MTDFFDELYSVIPNNPDEPISYAQADEVMELLEKHLRRQARERGELYDPESHPYMRGLFKDALFVRVPPPPNYWEHLDEEDGV